MRRTGGVGAARRAIAAAAAAMALAACGETRDAPQLVGSGRDGPSVGARPGAELPDAPPPSDDGGPQQVGMVQVAAFADSAPALRLRDSLVAAGWRANVRSAPGDTLPPWRVRVLPTADRELIQAAAAAWRLAGSPVAIVGDTASPVAPRVRVHPVNRGARGAGGRVRWALSPDRRALLVVEDPAGAGGTPVPDGFLHAAEGRAGVVQRDSVWDVAPDPAWRQVAYGRAFVVRITGRDAISAVPWLAIATRTNMDASVIRRGAFDVGTDGTRQGFAQPVIESLEERPADGGGLSRSVSDPVPMAGGWRVRWSGDAAVLAVGRAPARVVADDADPAGWIAVDARARLARGDVPSYVRLTTPAWTAGPTFGPGTAARGAARLPIEGGEVRSADGWITVRGGPAGAAERVVGPGTALAATASGRFVAALVPVLGAGSTPPSVRAVVYELTPVAAPPAR